MHTLSEQTDHFCLAQLQYPSQPRMLAVDSCLTARHAKYVDKRILWKKLLQRIRGGLTLISDFRYNIDDF